MASNAEYRPLSTMLRTSVQALASSVSRLGKTAELLRGSRAILLHSSAKARQRNGADRRYGRDHRGASLGADPLLRALEMDSANARTNPIAGTKNAPAVRCEICGKPVLLELANTDGDGKAVHEECYVHEVAASKDGGKDRIA